MLKAETLKELQKAATFMPARKFVEEYAEELAELPRAQPYINGIMTGVSNDQIRGSYAALAVVVRMDLDDLLKVSKPVPVASLPRPVIPSNVRIKKLPPQPADREMNREQRREFRAAVTLIKEVEAKLREEANKRSGKTSKLAQAKQEAKVEKPRPEVPRLGAVPSNPYVRSDSIDVAPVYMGAEQRRQAIEAFFGDVRHMTGGEMAGPKFYSNEAPGTFDRMKAPFVIQGRVTKLSRTPEQIVSDHANLLASDAGTRQYLVLYRRGQINANNVIEAVRRQFLDRNGVPLRKAVDVSGWTRLPLGGNVTPEKLEAYEAARRYVVNMTALGLTIPAPDTQFGYRMASDPIMYPLADQLRIEAGPSTRNGKNAARSGKGKSLARLLNDAVFGTGLAGDSGLVGDMNDIDKLLNGVEAE